MQLTSSLLCIASCLVAAQMPVQPTYILKKIGQGVKGAIEGMQGTSSSTSNPLSPKSIMKNTSGSECNSHVVNIFIGKDTSSSLKGITTNVDKASPQLVGLEPVLPTKTEESIPVAIPLPPQVVPQVLSLIPQQMEQLNRV